MNKFFNYTKRNNRSTWPGILVSFLFLIVSGEALGQSSNTFKAQFSNLPQWWQTTISLPNDPYKTLVSREGELLYDYDGPFYKSATGGFKTTVGLNTDAAKWISQTHDDPKIPVVKTKYAGAGFEITQEAFAPLTPGALATTENTGKVVRLDGGKYVNQWSQSNNYPAWTRTAAVNNSGAIHYQFTPVFGESSFSLQDINIALGFLPKGGTQQGQQRIMIWAEGSEKKPVDPVKDFETGKPGVYFLKAKDINRDGRIDIRVLPDSASANKNIYLNAFWAYPGSVAISEKDFVSGKLPQLGIIAEVIDGPPSSQLINRNDVVLVQVKNTSRQRRTYMPEIIVKSINDVKLDLNNNEIFINENRLTSTLNMQSVRQIVPQKWLVRLEPITVEANESKSFAIVTQMGSDKSKPPLTLAQVNAYRKNLNQFWLQESKIPFGRITVPDPTIQSLVESSIRNIWQARDVKSGVPVFQVGPTLYRGLWIVDGAFLLECATLLGATQEARNSIQYTLKQQQENGAFQVLAPQYFKENGIVTWTAIRHALLSQDKAWLQSVWWRIEKAIAYIQELRKQASTDPNAPWYGINTPGEIDGGIAGHATGFKYGEYSNAYWNLTGIKAAIFAANWLGKSDQAKQWQQDYDSFYNRVRETMKRDVRKDAAGNTYLPILMENVTNAAPQRAQWSFCQAVYPGQIFDKNDTLVAGNLAMLENTEQEGMVVGTGWMSDGIWNYFASFYGHAWLWQGNGQKAAECLYAMANHASPTLVWREEHNTNDNAYGFVGDMPHNWASAEFVRLTTHLLAIDRGNELHLLEGLPPQWAKPGARTTLNGIATPFGNLNMEVAVDKTGKTATIKVKKLTGSDLKKVIIHLKGLTRKDKTVEWDGKTDFVKLISLI
jgi:hypothetical protein